ncbi:MAG: hypothetical protein Ct9H300mP3_00180 [Gammaproteobacteria bacterium]|nr:MAG: hypothetical protein Ct9H300mP3_00180 [Gammaproteobacteria bacterium]
MIGEELAGPIHAITLHTFTADEWQERNESTHPSPDCEGGSAQESTTKAKDSVTIVTFYKVVSIRSNKLKREVERIAFKENFRYFFFNTPGGKYDLCGKRNSLEKVLILLEENFKITNIEPTWSESFKVPFKRLKVRIKENYYP